MWKGMFHIPFLLKKENADKITDSLFYLCFIFYIRKEKYEKTVCYFDIFKYCGNARFSRRKRLVYG